MGRDPTSRRSLQTVRVVMKPSRPPTHEILNLLPHRPPMLLVEEVLDVDPGRGAKTRRRTNPTDWYFQGHFPGEPVVPAIILVELIAQTGGIAAFAASSGVSQSGAKRARVAAFHDFKFPSAAEPGAILDVTARIAARVGKLTRVEGEVKTGDKVVAKGSVTLAEGEPESQNP